MKKYVSNNDPVSMSCRFVVLGDILMVLGDIPPGSVPNIRDVTWRDIVGMIRRRKFRVAWRLLRADKIFEVFPPPEIPHYRHKDGSMTDLYKNRLRYGDWDMGDDADNHQNDANHYDDVDSE